MKQPIPFGKYYLLERINVGGMAEVFKAKAVGVEGFERLVAVKRILPGIAADEEFITMFVDEAKIAVQLTHANIAQIFDLGRVDGSFFIALEYVHGKDLRTMFNRTRQRGEILPIPLTCYAIMKLCEGLDYAHNKEDSSGHSLHLVHRDVSPQNILVSYEGEVKIIDFGIAKAAGKVGRTQAGILKGKFGYMSPEQVLGLEIDRRSDVFGVGICLYELLTGERLFVAETDFATLEKVRSVDIMPPSTYNRRIPEELEQIVMRALARDRDQRYQSALQLHDELQAFMHTSGNLFARKDLSAYMHRVFAEEIEKESARDREFEQLDHSADGNTGLEPQPTLEHSEHALTQDEDYDVFDMQTNDARAAWSGALSEPLPKPESRRRTATLLGVPRIAAPRVPTVPRPVPGPASIPPIAQSRPPAPAPMIPSRTAQDMEWDEDELSTQIYDKPDTRPTDDALDALRVSVPEAAEPAPAPRVNLPRRQSANATITGVPHVVARPEPRAFAPRAGDTTTTLRPQRGRSMWGPAAAVAAIIGAIALGLLVFKERAPATVSLTTQPSHVAISVDGQSLGESNSPFIIGELAPGRPHEIVVSSPGHHAWSRTVELKPGETLTLSDVVLKPVETGFSLATQPRGASVFVDDKLLPERTPVRVTNLTPGEHRIRVELEGWAPWESVLHTNDGSVLSLPDVALQPAAAATRESEPEASAQGRGSRRYGSWRSARAAHGARAADEVEPETGDAPEPDKPAQPTAAPERSAVDLAPPPEPAAPSDAPERTAEAPPKLEPETAAVETGKLRVNSRPWSNVFIDGQPYGHTPRFNIELAAGPHTVELVNEEFGIRKTLEVTIAPGKVETRVVNLME